MLLKKKTQLVQISVKSIPQKVSHSFLHLRYKDNRQPKLIFSFCSNFQKVFLSFLPLLSEINGMREKNLCVASSWRHFNVYGLQIALCWRLSMILRNLSNSNKYFMAPTIS